MAGEVLEMRQIGYLSADPELRETAGDPVASFRLITNLSWRDKQSGDIRERAEGFRYEIWGEAARNLMKYAKKGSQLYIEAQPRNDSYGEGDDKKFQIRFRVTKWKLLDRPPRSGEGAHSAPAGNAAGSGFEDMDDDIPY